MVISKTPLRMSFVGGGSDLASYYERSEGGAVLGCTIDKYIYITVNKKFDDTLRISYSKTENVSDASKVEHRLIKAVLNRLEITGGLEITSIADIPSEGSGLGSSSSFTVGMLNALYAQNRKFASPEELANQACEIEIDILKEPIGKQDQYAAAYGGFNLYKFNEDSTVSIQPIICSKDTRKTLQNNVLMFYTGITRSSNRILSEQNKNTLNDKKKMDIMEKMVKLTFELAKQIQGNNLASFGEILHENWLLKKRMASGVSNPQIDNWYETGIKNGATGGKILGAGGGGFLAFYAPQEKHIDIIRSLPDLRAIPFEFEYQGSQIIFIH
jgi:D-glycero-alpha-D-manno-heptose-7-phosphate kinase